MAVKVLISLPQEFLDKLDRLASKEKRSRSEFIREALRIYMALQKDKKISEAPAKYAVKKTRKKSADKFPNIEVVKFTGGNSAVIRGTRVPVHILIGYLQIGETPETIATEIVPHISLAQVYEAMRYYFVHKAEIDKERDENNKIADLLLEFQAWDGLSNEALLNFEKELKKL
jgi:CopG family transcriptional regulator/antitoxin EndoAI